MPLVLRGEASARALITGDALATNTVTTFADMAPGRAAWELAKPAERSVVTSDS